MSGFALKHPNIEISNKIPLSTFVQVRSKLLVFAPDYCTHFMWNSGFFVLWSHICTLYYQDLECGIKMLNKLTSDHINLTPFSVMRVRFAAQVLSETGSVLNSFGPADAVGTAKFCLMITVLLFKC